MSWFYNLKIAVKLIIGFIIVAMIAGIVGIIGLQNINKINNADTLLYEKNTLGLNYAGNASIYFQRTRYNSLKMATTSDITVRDECISKLKDYTAIVSSNIKKYEVTISAANEREQYNTLMKQWDEYKDYVDQAIKMAQLGQYEQSKNIITVESADLGTALQTSFDDLVKLNSDQAKLKSDSNSDLAKTSNIIMIIVILIGMVMAITLGLFISRIISKPLRKMAEVSEKLALGDINVNVAHSTKDEIGNLAQSFGKVIENIQKQAYAVERIADGDLTVEVDIRSENDLLGKKLSEMVMKNNEVLSNISVASEQVAVGAKQVSDSSVALSSGSTEQASSVEELSATIEEISSQTKLNAHNANEANELAAIAKANAEQGNTQMAEMVGAITDINESSSNISKIIKVIDEIAFQTNILALNAAVEAARAGQHGKGFAVVAEEVRNLAARSANAARETTDLIEGSIKKAEDGTRIAKVTAESLNKIVNDIDKVAVLVNEIAVSSNEQATGISQVNQGINQVSIVVQNNSATSEESAAASEELSSQADLLKNLVSQFKLKNVGFISTQETNANQNVMKLIEEAITKKGFDSKKEIVLDIPSLRTNDIEFGKY